MPPYTCLTTTMANKVPITMTHQGASEGMLMASKMAVTIAVLSRSAENAGRSRATVQAISANTAVATASVI